MKIFICENADEIARLCAQKVINLIKRKEDAILGLATGSSPQKTYQQIIELSKQNNISFKNIKTFNLDEYVDYKKEKDSYEFFMKENLFLELDINLKNTNFPNKQNINNYDDLIKEAGGIDLQILGIGTNGHIAFNEPGTSFGSNTHIVNLTEQTIKDNSRFFTTIDDVPKQAYTMGLSSIYKAKEIILIATGKNKKKAIETLIKENKDISCPASILKDHPNVTLFLDYDCAPI